MSPKDGLLAELEHAVQAVLPSAVRRPAAPDDLPPDRISASDALLKSGLIVDADRALYEEYEALCDGPECPGSDGSPASPKEVNDWLETQPKYALCLSGGGIRSAAFCMGALRALALNNLLPQFHYLSTVSGGGYIAGWLLHLIKLNGYSVKKAAAVLADSQALPQVKNLRDFTNFLAPTPGLLSGDALSGGVLYMRNVLVNWMIFVPALVALTLIPCAYRDAICAIASAQLLQGSNEPILIALFLFALGLGALAWSVFHACQFVPSHAHDIADTQAELDRKIPGTKDLGRDPGDIFRRVVVPALIWAAVVPLCLATLFPPYDALTLPFVEANPLYHPGDHALMAKAWLAGLALAAAAVMFVTFFLADRRVQRLLKTDEERADHHAVFEHNWPIWLVGCLVSATAIFILLWLGIYASAAQLAAFGPVLILTAHVLQTTFYVALRRDPLRADLDREWLGRLNAQYLIRAGLFAAWAACALLLPELLRAHTAGVATLIATIGVASGPTAALMARRAAILLKKHDGLAASLGVNLFRIATLLAACLFAVSLVAVFSWAAENAINTVGGAATSWWAEALITGIAIPLLGAVGWLLGREINVNRFSMHSVYRNRLVRAFLGSARLPASRAPDTYTRFDPGDNPRLSEFAPDKYVGEVTPGTWGPQPRRLFPVIGVTLNLVGGTRTAWSERKSAPFTITPLRCGAAELEHQQIAEALRRLDAKGTDERIAVGARPVAGGWTSYRPTGAYAKTETYAGAERTLGVHGEEQSGLTLGTAMALSGAAVSSSMGYHSSPAFAFLLTLFDLRLGMWLPNPGAVKLELASPVPDGPTARPARGADSKAAGSEHKDPRTPLEAAEDEVKRHLNSPKPSNTLLTLFKEMCGNIDDQGEALYLSDGGHFDNLGLYEMLRRRCKCIVVIDASGDPEYSFAELGMAIRRANIDLDACVNFDPVPCPGQKRLPRGGLYATIHYPAREKGKVKEASGELLIIKPWLPDDTPTEVRAYHAGNKAFPHDSTANQFFAETQFESYRRLGEHVTAGALGHATDIEKLFASAKARKGT